MLFKKYIFLLSTIAIAFASAMPLSAEETSAPMPQAPVSETLQRLQRLKQENPVEFQRLIEERKNQIKFKVQEFRQRSPDKFNDFKKQISEKRMNRLRRMKQENPQAFQRDMQGRAERFGRMRQENPERFKKFMDNHPRLRERMTSSFNENGKKIGRVIDPRQNDNFRDRRDGNKQTPGERGELRRQERGSARQNGSQFAPRPNFLTNPNGDQNGGPQNPPGKVSGGSGYGGKENYSRLKDRIQPNQNRNGVGQAGGTSYVQNPANGEGGRNVRPYQQGPAMEERDGYKNPGKRPRENHPNRGGFGDGSRRRGH